LLLLTLLPAFTVTAAEAPASFDAAAYEEATKTILCDCGCHPQSVHDCACGRAAEMREEIQALVQQGMTGEEIIASYVQRFGEQIRVAPTADGFNLVAWLGPLLGLLGASVMLFVMLTRWSRRRAVVLEQAQAAPPVEPSRDAETYRQRLRQAVEELE
jgi:cytochrome c-type biogenesis protein CcmH